MKRHNFVASSLALLFVTGLQAAALHGVTDLGPGFQATSINNHGMVAGVYSPGTISGSRAFIYGNGQATLLGTLGGNYSGANALNIAGQVTGDSSVVSGTGAPTRAFIYSNGQMVDLGLGNSVGLSINDAGQITGLFLQPDGYHGFLYTGTQTLDLGVEMSPVGINNASEVTGKVYLAAGASHAFLYSGGKVTDLGTLGGSNSSGSAINSQGEVVGVSTTASGNDHAFLYSNGTMRDLGTLGTLYTSSGASGVNSSGQVVGSSSYFEPNGEGGAVISSAFLYSNGMMQDLTGLIDPTSGITLVSAVGINDYGQIVANGQTQTSHFESFLLTPVPEPTSIVLLASGLLLYAASVTLRRLTC